jgi:hypothetical protein
VTRRCRPLGLAVLSFAFTVGPPVLAAPGEAGADASAPSATSGKTQPIPEAATAPAPPAAAAVGSPRSPEDDELERLGIAGGLMFGKVYMLTITIATGALVACWADPNDSTCLLPETRTAWYELYVPVAGPFVTLRHEPVRDELGYALSFGALGAFQAVGFVLVAVSLATWEDDEPGSELVLTPRLGRGEQGLSLAGSF